MRARSAGWSWQSLPRGRAGVRPSGGRQGVILHVTSESCLVSGAHVPRLVCLCLSVMSGMSTRVLHGFMWEPAVLLSCCFFGGQTMHAMKQPVTPRQPNRCPLKDRTAARKHVRVFAASDVPCVSPRRHAHQSASNLAAGVRAGPCLPEARVRVSPPRPPAPHGRPAPARARAPGGRPAPCARPHPPAAPARAGRATRSAPCTPP